MRVVADGRTIELRPDTFVAQGGEASVHAVGDLAYKVFTDPSRVPPPERLVALRPLGGPDVIAPLHDLHDAASGRRIGFTLPFLQGWSPWVRMQSMAYQTREGLTPRDLLVMATGLADTVTRVHTAGAVIVDLSDLNVLYDPSHRRCALIDVDSWAIGSWPATAIADTIRDRHAASPTADSDWFSFAILVFQLFVGLHPYRGRHTTLRTLDERMHANVSAFHPSVTLPPVADLRRLPTGWRDWMQSVFDDGHRGAPPSAAGPPRDRTVRPHGVRKTVVQRLDTAIDAAFAIDAVLYVRSDGSLLADGRRVGPALRGLPLRRPAGPPASLTLQDGRVFADGVDTGNLADALFAHRGGVYGQAGPSLLAYTARRSGHVTAVEIARTLPLCTVVHRGCAIMAGPTGTWVYMFSADGTTIHRVPALDGCRVVDAAADHGVAQVLTADARGRTAYVVTEGGVHVSSTTRTDAFVLALADVVLLGHDDGLRIVSRGSPLVDGRVVHATFGAHPFVLRGRPAAIEGHEVCTYALTR